MSPGELPHAAVERGTPDDAIATLRRGMHLFYLDGSGVLFSETGQTLHLLNPAAALVVSLVQEGHDAPSVARVLQDLQGLDPSRAEQLVEAALAPWHKASIAQDEARAGPSPPTTAPVEAPAWAEPAVVEERHYGLLGSSFRLRFTNEGQARLVDPVLRHLATETATADVTVDIVNLGQRIAVYRDREPFAVCARATELAPVVKSLVWIDAVNRHDFLLDIHAGVVGNGRACLLLPGASGSGKSTLTAALVHAGYFLYSDEVALMAEGTLDVFPVPLAMCVKAAGIDALASRFPELSDLPLHDRADGKRVCYLSPPPGSLPPAADAPRPVDAIVFPIYSPRTPTELVPLPVFDALRHLLDECLVLRSRLDFARIERLVSWIGSTPAYRLHYAALDDATASIRRIFSPPQQSNADRRPSADALGPWL